MLAAPEISTVYRLLRRKGVSQREIAAMTGQSRSEVAEILEGRQVMAYDVLVRIADGLGVSRGYMGLAYDVSAARAVEPWEALASAEPEHVKRRRFLAHAQAVTFGVSVLGFTARRRFGLGGDRSAGGGEPWVTVVRTRRSVGCRYAGRSSSSSGPG